MITLPCTINIYTGPIFDRWRWEIAFTSLQRYTHRRKASGTRWKRFYDFMFFLPDIDSLQLSNPEGNTCMVCTCICMSGCVVTWNASIPVILWRYVQDGVTIAYMNGVEFFTKQSRINYQKSIYQTRNFAMSGGENPYCMYHSTTTATFVISGRLSCTALFSIKSL